MKALLTEKIIAIIILGIIATIAMFRLTEPENIVINGLVAIAGLITGEAIGKSGK
ncbi:MAG: hypothetical protein ACXABY_11910 [Candidatus Thorarchaeota archaeon]|jgi:hypothetical protein